MLFSNISQSPRVLSMATIETAVSLIAIALPFAFPHLGSGWFSNIETLFRRIARRKTLSIFAVGSGAVLLRIALLPVIPIPQPFIHDDFSFLLGADTFSHGRLTNPTPAMWIHFESFHIDMRPTYMSMYFPAQGLVLALGNVLLGHPWFGLLIANALMCAILCWTLQAWLPPGWSLLGGVWAVLHLSLFSYWIDTYTGAGALAALGGVLMLGGLAHFMKNCRMRNCVFMALGAILLANTRPFEGLLVGSVVLVTLLRWILCRQSRPTVGSLLLRFAPGISLLIVAAAGMGYYNYRVFGSATTLPYTVNRATYGVAPYFIWQRPHKIPEYRNEEMRRLYSEEELNFYKKVHSLRLYFPIMLYRCFSLLRFFAGLAMFPALIMLWRALHDKRLRIPMAFFVVMITACVTQIFLVPHYLAPFLGVLYLLGIQSVRHLRQWSINGKPVGTTMVRLAILATFLLACIRPFAGPLRIQLGERGSVAWEWLGTENFGYARATVERALESNSGRQLAIVRYAPDHLPDDEWVYNAADIDSSKVIWARELDNASNQQLVEYYRDRTVWLVQPDSNPVAVTPYSFHATSRPPNDHIRGSL
jgi:hypothetical protein